MTEVVLQQKFTGINNRKGIKWDKQTEDTPLVVDNAAYIAGKDLVYDVRGFTDWEVIFENTGANSIDMTIEKAIKDFERASSLVDADFAGEVAEAAIAAAADSVTYTKPTGFSLITALRFRFKETVGASPGEATPKSGGFT